MSIDSGPGMTPTPMWRRGRFWQVAVPVCLVVGAVAGLLTALQVYEGSNGVAESQTGWGTTYPTPKKPQSVKLDPGVQKVAKRFILTAVARKDLRTAYTITGQHIRQGMTLDEWLSGNIAVVPYVVTSKTVAQMKIDQSYKNRAQLEVYMTTPGQKSRDFFVDVVKTRNGKWVVDGWVPRGTPPIPVVG